MATSFTEDESPALMAKEVATLTFDRPDRQNYGSASEW